MSKAVLISIRPEWTRLILSGEKTIEVRKTRPRLETPFKCYIYCTKDASCVATGFKTPDGKWHFSNGHVVGEFVCDHITEIHLTDEGYDFDVPKMTCLKYAEMEAYLGRKNGYGWHISELKVYDEPKQLSEFLQCHKCEYQSGCKEHEYSCDGVYKVQRPPQSWMYVEELS